MPKLFQVVQVKLGNFAPTGDAKSNLKQHLKGFWANRRK